MEQALVFAQCFLDFTVSRQALFVANAQSPGGFQFGLPVIADAVFAYQARCFERDAPTQLMAATFGVDAVELSGFAHDLPHDRVGASVANALRKRKTGTWWSQPEQKSGHGWPVLLLDVLKQSGLLDCFDGAAIRDDRTRRLPH